MEMIFLHCSIHNNWDDLSVVFHFTILSDLFNWKCFFLHFESLTLPFYLLYMVISLILHAFEMFSFPIVYIFSRFFLLHEKNFIFIFNCWWHKHTERLLLKWNEMKRINALMFVFQFSKRNLQCQVDHFHICSPLRFEKNVVNVKNFFLFFCSLASFHPNDSWHINRSSDSIDFIILRPFQIL